MSNFLRDKMSSLSGYFWWGFVVWRLQTAAGKAMHTPPTRRYFIIDYDQRHRQESLNHTRIGITEQLQDFL